MVSRPKAFAAASYMSLLSAAQFASESALMGGLSHFGFAQSAARREGAIDVDIDLTMFVQVGLFVVLLLVLKPLLFDPMLKLFEERERRIEGARAEGLKLDRASAEAQGKYEAAMQKARASAGAERDKLRAEGVKVEQEILAQVRAETGQSMEVGRRALLTQVEGTRRELQGSAAELGASLASRVLGRTVGG
jgi:F-type H+-transporting ATPase subunit b